MARLDLSADRARELFRYDPDTGILYRRHATREKVGKAKTNGYLVVGVNGVQYQVHRIAWLVMTGAWPQGSIDHINRVRTDNRWCNLRDVPQSVNARNHHLVVKRAQMIGPVRDGDAWVVVLPHYRTTRTIGPFATSAEANAAFAEQGKWALMTEGRDEPKLRPMLPV